MVWCAVRCIRVECHPFTILNENIESEKGELWGQVLGLGLVLGVVAFIFGTPYGMASTPGARCSLFLAAISVSQDRVVHFRATQNTIMHWLKQIT